MPRFAINSPLDEDFASLNFEEFIEISRGLSISSGAASTGDSRGPDFLELGLSQTFNLRVQANGNALAVTLVSTLNPGDFAPVRLQIISPSETVTAELLERRLHHLRQVYAMAFLVDGGREADLGLVLREHPGADLEHELLSPKDKLVVREAHPGSLILSLIAKSKGAYRALAYVCAVPFAEGRKALLGRVKAGTELAELEVKAKSQDVRLKGADGVISLVKKIETIKDKDTRELIKRRLLGELTGLTTIGGTSTKPLAIDHDAAQDASFTPIVPLPEEPVVERKKTDAKPTRRRNKR